MTAVTFPLRPPRLAFAICGWRWQNDVHEIKYSVCEKKKVMVTGHWSLVTGHWSLVTAHYVRQVYF